MGKSFEDGLRVRTDRIEPIVNDNVFPTQFRNVVKWLSQSPDTALFSVQIRTFLPEIISD